MKLLVCGPRDMPYSRENYQMILKLVQDLKPTSICEGGAKGADSLARLAAKNLGIPCTTFKADWDNLRLAAGPIRNTQMLDVFEPDKVLAFVKSSGMTDGTGNMVGQARSRKVPVIEVVYAHVDP